MPQVDTQIDVGSSYGSTSGLRAEHKDFDI
jgi:hypothetical protein